MVRLDRLSRVAIAAAIAVLLDGASGLAVAQAIVPDNRIPEQYVPLTRMGDLQLRTWSIHGISPLVVLLTEAPAGAPRAERLYRHALTARLVQLIESENFSWFSLRPAGDSASALPDSYTASAEAAMQVLRKSRPAAVVGFGEGAALLSTLLAHDSTFGAAVALAPLLKVPETGRDSVWQELVNPSVRFRSVLLVESTCQATATGPPNPTASNRTLVLRLPQYNEWLESGPRASCGAEPGRAPLMAHDLWMLIGAWIRWHVVFPE